MVKLDMRAPFCITWLVSTTWLLTETVELEDVEVPVEKEDVLVLEDLEESSKPLLAWATATSAMTATADLFNILIRIYYYIRLT